MKSKDLQNVVFSKYQTRENPAGYFGIETVPLVAIRCFSDAKWSPRLVHRVVNITGSASYYPNRKYDWKSQNCLKRKETSQPENCPSNSNFHEEVCREFWKMIELLLLETQKAKRITVANWVRHNFSKEQSLKILFRQENVWSQRHVYSLKWSTLGCELCRSR